MIFRIMQEHLTSHAGRQLEKSRKAIPPFRLFLTATAVGGAYFAAKQ
jgi:hypothetical protein